MVGGYEKWGKTWQNEEFWVSVIYTEIYGGFVEFLEIESILS